MDYCTGWWAFTVRGACRRLGRSRRLLVAGAEFQKFGHRVRGVARATPDFKADPDRLSLGHGGLESDVERPTRLLEEIDDDVWREADDFGAIDG